MAKLLATIKAIITRLIFAAHGFIAIWQVTQSKKDPIYWYLSGPIGFLFLEGIFTLIIKKNQEWRWFCPSVFIYLSSVVPAIWLLELDKVERRLRIKEETINFSAVGADKILGVQFKMPDIKVDTETWITLIEQFLMLVLIIGRWMLPKGDLTRDQLSQLLLVYIGTAADIIEFFDSFKDSTIAHEQLLVLLTLGIWSWSLLQFTIVLSATRARKPRGGGSSAYDQEAHNCCNNCCCSIDAWGIALNIVLQDAPFLAFRLLIIIHYRIISYMNVFFTCKNTLVILLQLYRLYVVHSENRKAGNKKYIKSKERRSNKNKYECEQMNDVYIISSNKYDKKRGKRNVVADISDDEYEMKRKKNKSRHVSSGRKDTGYSTASSQTKSNDERNRITTHSKHKKSSQKNDTGAGGKSSKSKSKKHDEKYDYDDSDCKQKATIVDEKGAKKKRKRHEESDATDSRSKKKSHKKDKQIEALTEEGSNSSDNSKTNFKVISEKRQKKKHKNVSTSSSTSSTSE